MNDPLDAHLAWFEALTPASLAAIDRVYAQGARFRDPFNALEGRDAIARLYARMFERLDAPRFVVRERVRDGARAFVSWDFEYGLAGRRHGLHGGTLFVLDEAGLIAEHRDYWDAAEGVYERVPIVGYLLRSLKRRMA